MSTTWYRGAVTYKLGTMTTNLPGLGLQTRRPNSPDNGVPTSFEGLPVHRTHRSFPTCTSPVTRSPYQPQTLLGSTNNGKEPWIQKL